MIKRIRLATRRRGLDGSEFPAAWREAVAAVAAAPRRARPSRLTASSALADVVAEQRYAGVALEWFDDTEHLRRFESWLGTPEGDAATARLRDTIELDASPVVVTEENVARGADWLERRWLDGGPKLKQLAIATRADGLTLQQFLELWRSRAGKIGAVPIPEAYRGLAYVQNHPQVEAGRDWAYDAINEVYFEQLDDLLARIAYFERELAGSAENDLVSANWFLAVREEPISVAPGVLAE